MTDEQRIAARIGRRIASTRELRGLTQRELARRLRMCHSTISLWEAGKRIPTIPHLIAVGQALGCEARALLPALDG